jgi:very-short-patch-repair endonuclease
MCTQRSLCDDENCGICLERSFASSPKALYWSTQNEGNPRDFFRGLQKAKFFDCPDCLHTFAKNLDAILKGSWCPFCANRSLCDDDNCEICCEKSFASHPKSLYWSITNPCSPRDVFRVTASMFEFICDICHHLFKIRLSCISHCDQWCPYCVNIKLCDDDNCQICLDKSFASHPRAIGWSDQNAMKPRKVFKTSNKKYNFLCSICHHDFVMPLDSIQKGCWCPYCSNQKLCENNDCQICFDKSFASHPKVSLWSIKNNKTPRMVFKHSHQKAIFNCNTCPHENNVTISSVSKGHGCGYCCGQYLCSDDDCIFCLEHSFASNPKVLYWSSQNNCSPRDITRACGKRFKFNCPDCLHIFEMTIDQISRGSWCNICKYKTEKKIYTFLYAKFPTIVKQKRFEWCKNIKTKMILPFDFCIEELKIIIELDGIQHFEQVSTWKTPEETTARDVYKMKCAIENGYTVIRLLQEDVWEDTINWEECLLSRIKLHKSPKIKYISITNCYNKHKELFETIIID